MKKKKKFITPGGIISRAVGLSCVAVVAAAIIVGNALCFKYDGVITTVLCGTGVNFEGEEIEKAQALGDELCREIGRDSFVLLKNDNISENKKSLPLDGDLKKVNVFGWSATDAGFLLKGVGSGSSTINPEKEVTLLDGLEDYGIEYNTQLIDEYKTISTYRGISRGDIFNLTEPTRDFYTEDMLTQAEGFSDTALIVLSRNAGENVGEIPTTQSLKTEKGSETDSTRTYLNTSKYEEDLITMCSERFENVILLVNTTNSMHLNCLDDDRIDAALYVGITGQSAAGSIPEVLWGSYKNADGEDVLLSPSGKVANTYTFDPKTDSTFVNKEQAGKHIQYVEDIYYGYKWYETADAEGFWNDVDNQYGKGYDGVVQYPFGHGLSYTEFEWEITNLSIPNNSNISKYSDIEVEVDVTNVGGYPGKDVVQLYVTPPYYEGGIEKAHVNLMAFAKTAVLQPGQTQKLKLSFNAYDMASYDCYDKNGNGNARWELEEGTYEIKLMTNAHNLKECKESLVTEENNVVKYHVPTGGIKYNMDPKTKQIVKNRMTGETAYSGVPIDGSTVGAETSYLSRSNDFANFPTKQAPTPTSNLVNQAATYFNSIYDDATMPTTGQEANLRLILREDGSFATLADLNGETDAKLVLNEELMKDLANFNSPTWEAFLNQMSVEELCKIVEQGGFGTIAIESIGKIKALDTDGPAGFNSNVLSLDGNAKSQWTAYPSETLIACSWNAELAYRMGLSMGFEGSKTNVSGWYAPGVNLHRTAYNSRNFEYYSEDAVISGKLAAEVIRGAKTNGLYCYLKHFVLSEPGQNPSGYNTWITEQNLRENYLKAFEIPVKEGEANAIMSAFNRVGANWAGASYPCLTQILRTEWGFRGSVLTDYSSGGGVGGMNPKQGVRAGNDIWLNPNSVNSAPLDRNNPVDVFCARKAAKNVIFTYVDTYNYALTHDAGEDDRYAVEVGVKTATTVFAWWKPVLYVADGIAASFLFLVIAAMVVTLFIKKRSPITDTGDELHVDINKSKKSPLSKVDKIQKKIDKLQEQIKKLKKEKKKYEE